MDIMNFITSFLKTTEISMPEAVMFLCFGVSWPVSVVKALKTKTVKGKSPLFMALIALGYTSGIFHKIMFSRDILVILYLFNLSMILTDLWLYVRYNIYGKGQIQTSGLRGFSPFRKDHQEKAYATHSANVQAVSGHYLSSFRRETS